MALTVEELVLSAKSAAVVGASTKPDRMSNRVHKYLKSHGFSVYPVNPASEGRDINGDRCAGSVLELPEVDLVALFLSPSNQGTVISDMERWGYRPLVFFQPGAENPEGEERLRKLGFNVFRGCVMAVHRSVSPGEV